MTDDPAFGLLRFALRLDAVACGVLGVLALAGAPVLEGMLGLPSSLLRPLGLALLAAAGGVWFVASRAQVSHRAAWVVVGLNVVWAVQSVAGVVLGWWTFGTLGTLFVLIQAAGAALVAELEVLGLRRAGA